MSNEATGIFQTQDDAWATDSMYDAQTEIPGVAKMKKYGDRLVQAENTQIETPEWTDNGTDFAPWHVGENRAPVDESGHFEGYEDGVLRVSIPSNESSQAYVIVNTILPEVIKTFVAKNADYGETSFELGLAGQYAELWRKIGKLKGPMWEGKGDLQFEQVDEIVSDLIGHCLLTLYFIAEESAKAEGDQPLPDSDESPNDEDETVAEPIPPRLRREVDDFTHFLVRNFPGQGIGGSSFDLAMKKLIRYKRKYGDI